MSRLAALRTSVQSGLSSHRLGVCLSLSKQLSKSLVACALLVGLLATSGCTGCGGGSPFCGDGNIDLDEGEVCDDGNNIETDVCLSNCQVRPIPRLKVFWEFNTNEERGFAGDVCTDVGGEDVTVVISGPGGEQTREANCGSRQVTYEDLEIGPYMVTFRVTDDSGALLTAEPKVTTVMFMGGTDEEHTVLVNPEDWTTSYTGNFFFRTGWGENVSCEAAVPAVLEHELTLLIDGVPYSGQTDAGHPLDGSVFSPCRPLSEQTAQAVVGVPFGPADFTIVGRTSTGVIAYQETFETFIGAGMSNPEIRFEVPILVGLDAGLDASL